ncbi:lysoplasmalogenase [Streptomyces sp. NPDC051776]|uniref:lysoplasmalogenase n=1 Tax=Streptomyces sp. NPDC051776 TaxID=3155414 RepID=UPI0034182510
MVITGQRSGYGRKRMLEAAGGAVSRLARPDGHGRGALAAFGALAVADVAAVARNPRGLRRAAKPLLMPALAGHVLRRRNDASEPVPKALVAGLAFAAAGDTALLFDKHESAFFLGMAAFLGTQVSYTAGYSRLGALRGVVRKPLPALGCLAGWAAINAVLAPSLDARLRLPVAGYSLALTVMGAAALGVGGKVAAGAGCFLASDLLIGLQAAGYELPSRQAHEVLVMAGYLLGQYLITSGWLEHTDSRRAVTA